MATRVGGQYDDTTSTAPVVRSFTTGSCALLWGKFEGGAGVSAPASFNDPAGNTWARVALLYHTTGNEPGLVIYLCSSITSSGSVTVTIPYTGSPTFLQAGVEEWTLAGGTTASVDSVTTGYVASGGGSSGDYTAVGTVAATGAGFAVLCVAEFASLGGLSANATTPAFNITVTNTANGDSFSAYATVTGAGNVAPSIHANSGYTKSVQTLVIIKEVTAAANDPNMSMARVQNAFGFNQYGLRR